VFLGVWLGVAVVSLAMSDLALMTGLRGLRAAFWWVLLVYVAAAWLDATTLRRWLVGVLPVLAGMVAFAGWQAAVGADALVRAGYVYALNVREADGYVRAFSTMVYDAPFSHTMAVLLVAYALLHVHGSSHRDRVAGLVGTALAAAGIALGLNRAALLVAAVGGAVGVISLWRPDVVRRGMAVTAVIVVVMGSLLLVRGGEFYVTVTDRTQPSVTDRVEIWPEAVEVSSGRPLLGFGPGSVGVVAFTEELERSGDLAQAVAVGVTDNYYLAVLVQYGGVGLGVFILLLATFALRFRGPPGPGPDDDWAVAAGRGALGLLVALMVLVNVWEDFPTPLFIWTFVGVGIASLRLTDTPPASPPPPGPTRTSGENAHAGP
jgi:hypothetical protein